MRVILCQDLERKGSGVSLDELRRWLAREHEAEVIVSSSPCSQPEVWLEGITQVESGVVLGLCHAPASRIELLARARRAGLGRGALQWVQLGQVCEMGLEMSDATEMAKRYLAGALARISGSEESDLGVSSNGVGGPQNDKMLMAWDQKVSRRSLFRLPPVRYEVIPSILESLCADENGCRICSELCPHDALGLGEGGRMEVRKNLCTGCGACVSVCPRRAFAYPGNSLPEIGVQIRALLGGTSGEGRGGRILFHCHNSAGCLDEARAVEGGWLPVEIACLSMVTPTWVFQCLNLGAESVAFLPCPAEECRFGETDTLGRRVEYCQQLLGAMGMRGDCVRILGAEDFPGAEWLPLRAEKNAGGAADEASLAPDGAAEAVLSLSEQSGENCAGVSLAHEFSPLGAVEVSEGCTLCGSCVSACPAGALHLKEDENVSLVFDPRTCVGCRGCVPVCPEDVAKVQRVTDVSLLAGGRKELFQSTSPRCVKCGAPVAPQAMLDRLRAAIGNDAAYEAMSRHCLDCRKTLF